MKTIPQERATKDDRLLYFLTDIYMRTCQKSGTVLVNGKLRACIITMRRIKNAASISIFFTIYIYIYIFFFF